MTKSLKKLTLLSQIFLLNSLSSCLVMPDYFPSNHPIIASELKFNNEEVILHFGGSTTLEYTFDEPESNENLIWQPADTTLISVSESGTIQANNISGKTTVTLIAENKERKNNLSAKINVTVVSNEEFFKTNAENEITGILDTSINNVLLPQSLNDRAVTTIAEDAFYDCSNLKTLVIPTGYTTIKDHALDGVSTLVNLQLPSTLTYFGVSYGYLNSLTNVFFGSQDRNRNASNTYFISGTKNYIYSISTYTNAETSEAREYAKIVCAWNNFTQIPTVIDDSTRMNVFIEEICPGAFYGIKNFKNVTLHERIRIVGEKAFAYSTLQEVVIPSSITTISPGAFSSIPSLAGIKTKTQTGLNKLGNYFTISNSIYEVTGTGKYKLIAGCKNSSLITGSFNVEIGPFAFDNIFFPNMNITLGNNITAIYECAYRNNKNIESIFIPSSVTVIKNYISSEGYIRGIDVLGGKIKLESDVLGPFYGCSSLRVLVPFAGLPPEGYESAWSSGTKGVEYGYTPPTS